MKKTKDKSGDDSKPKILIVDDKVENLVALEKLLGNFDVEFVRALSGNEALVNTFLHEFALALVDVQMPDMDGYETVEMMRQEERTMYLPVIFVSAIYKDDFYVIKGMETGAVDFISKPIIPEIIRGKVRVFVDMYKQKKELEKINVQLQIAKDKAEEATHTKSLFLASMSHEIRTPMNGIMGMADILKGTRLSEDQEEYVKIISISSNNLLTIINDILDFSKIESGQVDLESISFDLKKEVDEIIKLLYLKANEKGLELKLSIAQGVPEILKGDPVRLKQIIINLINNAIKFTETGWVKLQIEKIKEDEKTCKLLIQIIDSGVGISDEGKKRLFKAFSQSDATITRKYGGTGLGLVISKNLSKLMKGEIGVESEEGKGSKFWFTAEFEKSEGIKKEIEESIRSEKENAGKLKILLAEDNLINQKVAIFNVEKLGHEIDVAGNGKIALDKYMENTYDVILMDIQMPIMSGVEATRLIRESERDRPDQKPIKIIAMTANAINGDRDRYMAEGMDDYISKPFKAEDLERLLKEVG